MFTIPVRAVSALLLVPSLLRAQRPTLSTAVKQYVSVDTPVVALTHVRVIDGTGAAAKDDQTLIITGGNIVALGAARSIKVPDGAQVMDLTGKSVIPGLVMMHEHLYYPTGPGVYGADYVSFSRLYLAGGVTSMRTGGNVGGYADLNLAAAIKAGTQAGPWIDATAPYVNGPSPFTQMYALKDSADARRFVAFWADAGATSFKAYMNITRAELAAAVDEAHKRGLKITGHLCSVTYREAADIGIDDLEHGFFVATDFVNDKQPDVCPAQTGMPLDQAMEVAFFRAGGLLLAGTDPTGGGGVIPGYSDQRQVELLVASGLTPLEAIKVCTLNGATYLARADRVGSIAVGKQADLVVIDGNPAATISDIRHVTLVFKQGVGYDPAKLIESVKGKVGLF